MAVVCGCDRSEESAPKPSIVEELAVNRARRDPQAAARLRGRAVYEHYCVRCHGTDGQGNGFNSTLLKVPPRNFTDPAFRKQATEQRLTKAIRGGGPAVGKSVLMPPWGRTLSGKQIADVVAFLKSLKPPQQNRK